MYFNIDTFDVLAGKALYNCYVTHSFVSSPNPSTSILFTSARHFSSGHSDRDTAAKNAGRVPDLVDFTFK